MSSGGWGDCPSVIPVSGQQLVKSVRRVIGDTGQYIGKPGLRVDIIRLCRDRA
jgi:hypothetical protein